MFLTLFLGVQEKLGIMNRGVVYALYHFDADNEDELSVIEGDAVMVLRRGDENEGPEWWFALLGGSNQSEKGYIPRNILGVHIFQLLQVNPGVLL